MMSTSLPSTDLPHQKINHEILSSRQENAQSMDAAAANNTSGDNMKMKRFLFFNNNPYLVSKTVTSYAFTSKTSTVTVDVAINAGLNCLPTGFVVC
jgi:hypothetical protein